MKDYPKILKQHQPQFSTLNKEVIPTKEYLEAVDNYSPKFDIDIIKSLAKQAGLKTPDERIYKMMSVLLEDKLVTILDEVNAM